MFANALIKVTRSKTQYLAQRCWQRRKCIERRNAEHHDRRRGMFFTQAVEQPIDGVELGTCADQGGDVIDASRKENDRYPIIGWQLCSHATDALGGRTNATECVPLDALSRLAAPTLRELSRQGLLR